MRRNSSNKFWATCHAMSWFLHIFPILLLIISSFIIPEREEDIKIGGWQGQINTETGISQEQQDPIKVNVVGTNQVDARQLIAQRKARLAAQREAQQAQERAKLESQQKVAQQVTPTQPEDAVNATQNKQADSKKVDDGQALVKVKDAAKTDNKDAEKVTKTQSKKDQKELAKTQKTKQDKEQVSKADPKQQKVDNKTQAQTPKITPQKAPPTAEKKPPTPVEADADGDETQQLLEQLQKESSKSNKTNAQTTKAQQSALEKQTGNNGGDGAEETDLLANQIARYRQRVQAIIMRNYSLDEFVQGSSCRIAVEITKNGTLKNPVIVSDSGNYACERGLQAIKRTKAVPIPADEIYPEVRNTTFFFQAS